MKKDTPKYVLGLSVLFGCLFEVSTLLQAQNTAGITDNEILIGSCSALEGPSHFLGTETVTGAKGLLRHDQRCRRCGRAQTETDLL
jgi:hypothetical protein